MNAVSVTGLYHMLRDDEQTTLCGSAVDGEELRLTDGAVWLAHHPWDRCLRCKQIGLDEANAEATDE